MATMTKRQGEAQCREDWEDMYERHAREAYIHRMGLDLTIEQRRARGSEHAHKAPKIRLKRD